ncbi:uncharacterized protein LOC115243157 [Formica exsecta]|uniref:uncharacterized protein LOC115243157 n=1 Tax=Formica exsecta TaxID=72781 RepID=UPI001144A374|nr:uncharacterized protein LOC115243157 [Formica exsecta]
MEGQEQVTRLTVKAPPFWPDKPELWFAQLESQLTLGGITQDTTKYSYVLAHLETRYAREIQDIVMQPPAQGKYEAVKRALTQRLTATQEQRIRQLLEHEELGDRKPSQFLRHLQTLANNNVPEQLLRTLWLGRLPQQAQVILATRTEDRLEDVAEQADRITEVTSRMTVAVATATQPSIEDQIKALTQQVEMLSAQIRERHSRSRSRARNQAPRERSSSRVHKRREANKDDGQCFFHQRFGVEAKKCRQPCTFKKENTEGSR